MANRPIELLKYAHKYENTIFNKTPKTIEKMTLSNVTSPLETAITTRNPLKLW